MSKKKLPWFPCYPDAWMGDTRHMTDAQARVYWDFLCLLYIHEEDGALHAPNKWIAHELHVHLNKWLSVRKFLVADKKLVENQDGSLTNDKAAKVCLERKARAANLGEVAGEREAERRAYRDQNPTFDFAGPPKRAPLRLVTPPGQPPGSPGVSPRVSLGGGRTAISLSDQGAADHAAGTHLHPHIRQEEKNREEAEALKLSRPLPPGMREALIQQAGLDKAQAWIDEYYHNGWAKGAKSIRSAFPGFLASEKNFNLIFDDGRGQKRKGRDFRLGDYTKDQQADLCGRDEFGNVATGLPKKVRR